MADAKRRLKGVVQDHVDRVARARDYNDGNSCASCAASTVEAWRDEAQAFVAWRDAVWPYVINTVMAAVAAPRDRTGTFDPALIAKYQRRFPGFDAKIISMSARGMSTREITGHLQELYGIEVSAELISTVTDPVIEAVTTWQNRPLEATYPLVFLDAIRVKFRDEGLVRNKAIHVAIGVRADGAKFWLRILNELKNRGVEDILLAVVDG